MAPRDPIHLGSGEPMLLLHPFILSQNVWKGVAPLIADTGRYEVFAPTMLGHNGGGRGAPVRRTPSRRVSSRRYEPFPSPARPVGALRHRPAWRYPAGTCRGRARTLTGIAPAGGWNHFTPAKFEIVAKFLAAAPVFAVCRRLGRRAAKFPFARQLAYPAVSATPDVLSDDDILELIDDAGHCSAYYQMLVKSLTLPGLLELAKTRTPTHLVVCEKDRVLPTPRFTRQFTNHLPKNTKVTTLDGVGHVPMYEAPQRIADVITDFVDQYAHPKAG